MVPAGTSEGSFLQSQPSFDMVGIGVVGTTRWLQYVAEMLFGMTMVSRHVV